MKRYDVPDRHEMWARSRERLSLWFCQQFEDRKGFYFNIKILGCRISGILIPHRIEPPLGNGKSYPIGGVHKIQVYIGCSFKSWHYYKRDEGGHASSMVFSKISFRSCSYCQRTNIPPPPLPPKKENKKKTYQYAME